MKNPINVFSEIGKLKKVILHRPGRELNNLAPDMLEKLLFDEIPYLVETQREHDGFAKVLVENGVEVFYLEDLVAEAIEDKDVFEQFIQEYLDESDIFTPKGRILYNELLHSYSTKKELINRMMEGMRRKDMPKYERTTLTELCMDNRYFEAKPMPNLYFTRDPFSLIGNGVSINKMWSNIRNRETLFGKYIFKYHPMFKEANIPHWYDRENKYSIEGGDELVLSREVVAIGISQRTEVRAIEVIANNLLSEEGGFKTVLAFQIPEKREFMHLDTVFTMIDRDLFTVHPGIEGPLVVFAIKNKNGKIIIEQENKTLEEILKYHLNISKAEIVRCGAGDPLDASREQWNDGSNTLAIAPREVIVYDRNVVTNAELEKYGVKLHKIKSGELSRGRGGPRCMSMPLYREDIDA